MNIFVWVMLTWAIFDSSRVCKPWLESNLEIARFYLKLANTYELLVRVPKCRCCC